MANPTVTGEIAEKTIVQFMRDNNCKSPYEQARALETLMARAALEIEKSSGAGTAVKACTRTSQNIQRRFIGNTKSH